MSAHNPWIEWDRDGRAKERLLRRVKCPNHDVWEDYTGQRYPCSECHSFNEENYVPYYERRPEYDAPVPWRT